MLLISNWKAYVADRKQASKLVAAATRLSSPSVTQVVVPSAPFIGLFAPTTGRSKRLTFGAQDVSVTSGGAATGEVSAEALAALGVTHVLIGHSERRAKGETNEIVLAKAQQALAHGLIPVLCIGERKRDPEAAYLTFLRKEIAAVFGELPPKDRARVVIAYEPIWAIGKSSRDSIQPSDLEEMVLYIRKVLSEYLPRTTAQSVPILYGGSVDTSNIAILAAEGRVDGFLVGRASTNVAQYTGLLKALK